MNARVLIVDDDEEIQTQVKWALCNDFEISMAADRAEALKRFRHDNPVVTLLDLGLPPSPNNSIEGMATLEGIKQFDSEAKIIIITGQSEKENALRAIGAGAHDILDKPFNYAELQFLVQRAATLAELEREYAQAQNRDVEEFEGMIGSCPAMQRVFLTIEKVAPSNAPVLILGESGTGKEMVAQAIHRRSPRKDGPFVAINCNAIPEKLIESELFGHEKGAFTDAHSRRKGLIETAAGGTLFLDEIGDLPLALQVKLLRFLQEKTIQRVGGREEKEIDTRILAATNVDLIEATKEKRFREDLYYRLAVVICELPPLRERGDDIKSIAQTFLKQCETENQLSGMVFSPEALDGMICHSWPGNIRELQNHIQRAVVMAEANRISLDDICLNDDTTTNVDDEDPGHIEAKFSSLNLKAAKEKLERTIVERALAKHCGKITAAASDMGISRPTFYDLMNRHGISKSSKKK